MNRGLSVVYEYKTFELKAVMVNNYGEKISIWQMLLSISQ